MLEKVDLTRTYDKKQFKQERALLRRRLYDLQHACYREGIPSMIVFEGWDAAGKGSTVAELTARLDPRGFKLYPIQAPRTFEMNHPWLWRFWLKTPNHGEMAIFDRSWYGRVLVERVEKLIPKRQWQQAYRDIADFERMLADDGVVIIKFFLHISRKEQKRRFVRLEANPLEAWHVQPEDWDHYRNYGRYLVAYEEMFERTDTEWGPWTIVEATDRWWSFHKVFTTINQRLEEALGDRAPLTEAEDEIDRDTELDTIMAGKNAPVGENVQPGEAALPEPVQTGEEE